MGVEGWVRGHHVSISDLFTDKESRDIRIIRRNRSPTEASYRKRICNSLVYPRATVHLAET